MENKVIPGILWYFMVALLCETQNVTDPGLIYARGRTPIEIITGKTSNISEYLHFGVYAWVVFL